MLSDSYQLFPNELIHLTIRGTKLNENIIYHVKSNSALVVDSVLFSQENKQEGTLIYKSSKFRQFFEWINGVESGKINIPLYQIDQGIIYDGDLVLRYIQLNY